MRTNYSLGNTTLLKEDLSEFPYVVGSSIRSVRMSKIGTICKVEDVGTGEKIIAQASACAGGIIHAF